ncbi:MAG: aldolase/citrate lyase family protein, partial [Halodesulfurarchaeum sp.]
MAPKASGDERNEIERTDAIDRLRAGEPVSATWISLADPAVAEITATLGFDVAFFDTEHTPADLETVANLLRGLESMGETELILRVPSGDPAYLKRVLDIVLSGVMVPMIETKAQAEDFVEATTYPPDGQ